MKFVVADELFARFPAICFGVVMARDIPTLDGAQVSEGLTKAINGVSQAFPEGVRGHSHIAVWREAFMSLGCNPNKFLSSVEALSSRVYKSGQLPAINPIVDLINSISLRYILPMGAHDLDSLSDDIELRFSRLGDRFTPFGMPDQEEVPLGEVVYASGSEVRTRRWVWRQSEYGKITAATTNVFFPIDSFGGVSDGAARIALDELALLLSQAGASVATGWVDATNRSYELVR